MDSLIREYVTLSDTSPTGLVWRKDSGPAKAGTPALIHLCKRGYYQGSIRGKQLLAHRVVYFLIHGEWPALVDHRDGSASNNTDVNLRAATYNVNMHNRVHRGTTLRKGKWAARIRVNGVGIHIGTYATEELAHAAYLAVKRQLHPTAPERCYVQDSPHRP